MSWNCDIVIDLISLYHDGLASEATKQFVSQHLTECPTCRQQYKQYRKFLQKISGLSQIPSEQRMEQNFSLLANRMRRRRMMLGIGMLSYVCASVCCFTMLLLRLKNKL